MTEKRIEQLERQLRELMQRTANLPARWAVNKAWPTKLVVLDGSLSAGGSATGSVYSWDGTSWTDTSENITVRDYRTSGDSISSDTRCVVLRIFNAWWVVSTQC